MGKRELSYVCEKGPRGRDFYKGRALQMLVASWEWSKEKHQVQDKAFEILESGKNGFGGSPFVKIDYKGLDPSDYKKLGAKLKVRWNARGKPVGEESQGFVSYIGVIVRREVPISMEN